MPIIFEGGPTRTRTRRVARPGHVPRPTPTSRPSPTRDPAPTVRQPTPVRTSSHQTTVRSTNRRDNNDQRRQQAESIRGKGAGLRSNRSKNRLAVIENSMLGTPAEVIEALPLFIGEQRFKGSAQALTTGTTETVTFASSSFDAERAGYTTIYDTTTDVWTIPVGLSGVWYISGIIRFAGNATGNRTVYIRVDGATVVYEFRVDAAGTSYMSLPINYYYFFSEGQTFEIRANQTSGGNLNINSGNDGTFVTAVFMGV